LSSPQCKVRIYLLENPKNFELERLKEGKITRNGLCQQRAVREAGEYQTSTASSVSAVGQKAGPHGQHSARSQWDAIAELGDAKFSPSVIPNTKNNGVSIQIVVPIYMKHFTGPLLHSHSEEEATEVKVRPLAEFVSESGPDSLMHPSGTQLVDLCVWEASIQVA
jgi:hypothetical protein